ncbi:hypothetical protein THF5H11_11188 [Vibrio jasicida]|uniref:Transposase n=1 Tax=Vibrio jasicida TaxID=766224 RepID=A0AAU9QML7_9VIBR|nr:hypothetical protein THF5H11_11188 [Vibrio jasicida]CAH1591613.1 hypothetical protein THF1C08_300059 [Vibrio jasicida]CAH1594733.1 hypothetical protein THF1A12_290060 [Vibrio jasicida]CAH1604758.1 hypothetical protein THF5G08_10647 [Vibrio jasicida]
MLSQFEITKICLKFETYSGQSRKKAHTASQIYEGRLTLENHPLTI